MRGPLTGLPSPHPLAETLPAIYQSESFTERFCAALDEVLAPVLSTLDNLSAYLDVRTAPEDLLPWLSYWLGMPADAALPTRQRELLLTATRLHGWQGTRQGVERAVTSVFGFRTVVSETGGAGWSHDAGAPLPGTPEQAMVVEVHVPRGQVVDRRRVDALVTAVKPAHVVHRVDVVEEA